jgi:hypothetical protein
MLVVEVAAVLLGAWFGVVGAVLLLGGQLVDDGGSGGGLGCGPVGAGAGVVDLFPVFEAGLTSLLRPNLE